MDIIKLHMFTVYEAIVSSGVACTLRSLVYATGLTERQVVGALGQLKTAAWINAEPDWSSITDSGYLSDLFAQRTMRLRSALNDAEQYLSHTQLRGLRTKLAWSQQKTADFLGITRSLYSMLETGQRRIDHEYITLLKDALKKCQNHV